MNSKMKICPNCFRICSEEKCPDCGMDVESLEKFADDLNRQLEKRRKLHVQYADPSYAEKDKIESIRYYSRAYRTLVKADYQNREKYLFALVKTYDIFDKGFDFTDELDYETVDEILDSLLEFTPDKEEYLYLKAYYAILHRRYEESLKYVEKLLEMDSENENHILLKEELDRIQPK